MCGGLPVASRRYGVDDGVANAVSATTTNPNATSMCTSCDNVEHDVDVGIAILASAPPFAQRNATNIDMITPTTHHVTWPCVAPQQRPSDVHVRVEHGTRITLIVRAVRIVRMMLMALQQPHWPTTRRDTVTAVDGRGPLVVLVLLALGLVLVLLALVLVLLVLLVLVVVTVVVESGVCGGASLCCCDESDAACAWSDDWQCNHHYRFNNKMR